METIEQLGKQLDTYKVGTTRNSTSTMHTIMRQPFTKKMFSFDYEYMPITKNERHKYSFENVIDDILNICNLLREKYLETKDKRYWTALIQVLPSGFNQLSTVTFNYENLRNIYFDRRYHRLEEWREFCDWILGLPHARELITYEGEEDGT